MSIKDSFGKAKSIGLFDSGLGGLSVLKQLLLMSETPGLPQKEFLYFADTARCPYGGRSQSEIQEFVKQIVAWCERDSADLVIMACNTSAALVEPAKRSQYSLNLIDLLQSTAASIAQKKLKRVGVMSTRATACSLAFTRSIKEEDAATSVFELGCPDLVPLVESNKSKSKDSVTALEPYISELIAYNVDAIVYGCTHFPFLEDSIRRLLLEKNARHIELIDPACCLREALSDSQTKSQKNSQMKEFQNAFEQLNKRCRFVTTGNIDSLARGIRTHLGLPFDRIEYLSLDELTLSSSTSNDITKSISYR